jgi:hypothetical protein
VPLPAGVLAVADQRLLLGLDGDDRLGALLEVQHPGGDGLDLRVAIRMLAACARLARPAQRRRRIPPWGGLHQRGGSARGRGVVRPPAHHAAPGTCLERRPRQACCLGHQSDAAAPQPHGLRRSPQSPSRLIQDRAQRLDLLSDGPVILHGLDSTTDTLLVKFISRRFLSARWALRGRWPR